MTTPDPLEALRIWEGTSWVPGQVVPTAIAAWEKERADRAQNESYEYRRCHDAYDALRAEVLKVAEEMGQLAGRFDPDDSRGTKIVMLSARLRKACE